MIDLKKWRLGATAFAATLTALSVAAAAIRRRRRATGGEGHAAPDLAADATPGERAPPAFRPDMDAPMSVAEREALRPATGPAPTLVGGGTSLPTGG